MIAPLQNSLRHLITNGAAEKDDFPQRKFEILEAVRGAVVSGIEFVQIREKRLPARLVFEVTVEAVRLAKGSQTKILVNDRFDIAMAAGAHGVHLPGNSLRAGVVRRLVPKDLIIGVSTHLLEEMIAARDEGASFAMFGPVFETPGKDKPSGVEMLADICRILSPFPVIAVGGIDASNYKSALKCGAAGYAAIRYLNEFVTMKQ